MRCAHPQYAMLWFALVLAHHGHTAGQHSVDHSPRVPTLISTPTLTSTFSKGKPHGAVQTWFWWFNAEQRRRVRELQKPERAARTVVERLNREHMAQLSDAKRELGVWSSMGAEESRNLFW